jgi:hypothetical protein
MAWNFQLDSNSSAAQSAGLAYVPPHVPESRGPPPGSDLARWAKMTVERIRAGVFGGRLSFPQWFGNVTEETAEIRAAYRVMWSDPILKAALSQKILSVAQLDPQVHPADPDHPADRAAAEFALYSFAHCEWGMPGILTNVFIPGHIDGWSLCEPVWGDYAVGRWRGKWGWSAFKGKDTRRLQPTVDNYLNVTGIRATVFGPGRIYDRGDFVYYPHAALFENPYGLSDFRAAYRAWFIKKLVWELRGFHLERYTSPMWKGVYTDEGKQREALEQALSDARSNTWITVPQGVLVEAIQIATNGTDDFKAAIADCNDELMIGIVGSTLTSLTSSNSDPRGDSGVQQGTAELFQWHLAALAGHILTRQALPALYELNFAGVEPGVLTFGAIDERELGLRADVDTKLQALGLKLSAKEAYHIYSRQQPAGPDDVLGGGDPPAAPDKPPPASVTPNA